jgi:hypothetical protein
MLRAQPSPHQYTLLGFMPLPPRPARPCAVAFFASAAGFKYLSPPRVRGNGRRSDHSDDPIPWRITAPAGASHLSLMMGRWSAPLAHRRLSPPSFLFAFFFFCPRTLTRSVAHAPFLDDRNEKRRIRYQHWIVRASESSLVWASGMGCEGTISSAVVGFKFY